MAVLLVKELLVKANDPVLKLIPVRSRYWDMELQAWHVKYPENLQHIEAIREALRGRNGEQLTFDF